MTASLGRKRVSTSKFPHACLVFARTNLVGRFHAFFDNIDHYRKDYYMWATASGIKAATQSKAASRTDQVSDEEDDDEEADINGQEG